MASNIQTKDAGIVTSGLAAAGSVLLAGYILFTEVTTFSGTTEPATGLESGNPFLLGIALLPVALSAIGLAGSYYGKPMLLVVSGVILLVLGFMGVNVGIFYVGIGLAMFVAYALVNL